MSCLRKSIEGLDPVVVYVAAKAGPCPFMGVAFAKVPLYDPGYGCPCCKGLRDHQDITQAGADAFNKKMADAEDAVWSQCQRILDDQTSDIAV